MTCCVFFAVINDAGDYSILSAYRACRDARRRVETGVSPCDAGGVGGIPPTFARTRATDSSHTSHRLLGGEKIAGSDFSRAQRTRRARIRDDTRKAAVSALRTQPADSPPKG